MEVFVKANVACKWIASNEVIRRFVACNLPKGKVRTRKRQFKCSFVCLSSQPHMKPSVLKLNDTRGAQVFKCGLHTNCLFLVFLAFWLLCRCCSTVWPATIHHDCHHRRIFLFLDYPFVWFALSFRKFGAQLNTFCGFHILCFNANILWQTRFQKQQPRIHKMFSGSVIRSEWVHCCCRFSSFSLFIATVIFGFWLNCQPFCRYLRSQSFGFGHCRLSPPDAFPNTNHCDNGEAFYFVFLWWIQLSDNQFCLPAHKQFKHKIECFAIMGIKSYSWQNVSK